MFVAGAALGGPGAAAPQASPNAPAGNAESKPAAQAAGMPPSDWAYAHDIAALHRIHCDQLYETAPRTKKDAARSLAPRVVSHADAVMIGGASWGIASKQYVDNLREAPCRRPLGRSPHDGIDRAGTECKTEPIEQWKEMTSANAPVQRLDGETLTVLAPVRAEPRCLACHPWKKDALLGAFEYKFREIADD